MSFDAINARGLVMVGCGNMGAALLKGWLEAGLSLESTSIIDPSPSAWVKDLVEHGLTLNRMPTTPPAVVILATKPYVIEDVLDDWYAEDFHQTVFLSIAAGISIGTFEDKLSKNHPIVRTMPNTPVSVGEGVVAYIGNKTAAAYLPLVETLLSSVGLAVELENEKQLNAVTALSGSGPAYIFQLAESMAMAGQKLGLSEALAMQLAKQTILGAGKMMATSSETPAQLRINVTSPGGTTQAALEVLKEDNSGFDPLLEKAMLAAHDRTIELG
ncbi:pyrroline-5-carboxylate reductase [Psychromonas sp. PT13]|uniref:pyrroline-5-carboxylate reductase n=1 Tax=Psychromonas sp. PT13 TaxID=3439547 RepID=UPI003EBF44B1